MKATGEGESKQYQYLSEDSQRGFLVMPELLS